MTLPQRALPVIGEGALAGLVAGSTLGAWQVILNADLSHRMFMLAAWRFLGPAAAGTGIGIVGSVVVAAILFSLRRRGARASLAGVLVLALLYLVASGLAAWPMRNRFFILHQFCSHALSILTELGSPPGCSRKAESSFSNRPGTSVRISAAISPRRP